MNKLAWYVVIMVAIDVLLYLARFCVKASKTAKQDDPPPADTAPQATDTDPASASSDTSATPPSA